MKKILLAVLAIVMMIGCSGKKEENVIKIACNLPMTGDLGYLGEKVKRGLNMALNDNIDALSEIGYCIEIDYQDNRGQSKDAVSIYRSQKLNKPDLYMSGVTSQTLALKDMVNSDGFIHHIWSFSPLFLQENDNCYRTWLNLGIEANQYVKIIEERKAKKVAYIYVDILGCQQQCQDVVIPKVKELNPDVEILPLPYPVTLSDMKDIVLKANEYNPDLIIINGFKNHMINLIHNLHAYNMVNNNVIASFDLLDAYKDLNNMELEGIAMSVPLFMIDNASEFYSVWKNDFYSIYGSEPEYTDAYAYDFGLILVEICRQMKLNNCTFKEAINQVDITGVTGNLSFNQKGELSIPITLCSFRNKKIVPFE